MPRQATSSAPAHPD